MGLFKLDTSGESRVYGLDVFRAVAILLVVLSHGGFIIDKFLPGFPWVRLIDGVELFFVLSGFLIGTILIRIYEKQGLDRKELVSFWKRRWLRTVPNYYLVLGLNVLFVATGLINGKIENFNWKFLFFLQNFNSYFTDFFWESWSLTIEEWFYILTPLTIIIFHNALSRMLSKKMIIFVLSLVFIILPLLYRISLSGEVTDYFWYDVKFRKVVMTRLDAIMYGVFFAWIKNYYPQAWKRIAIPFFIIGLIFLYGIMQVASLDPVGFLAKTFYFSCMGIGAAMLLPFADSVKKGRTAFAKAMTHISLISYSMYLINLSLIAQVIEKNFPPEQGIHGLIMYIIYWSAVIIFATLLYKYFEKPVMDLRNRTTTKIPVS